MVALILWLLITMPIVIEVNKQIKITLLSFPFVVIVATFRAPEYYYYIIKQLFTNKK